MDAPNETSPKPKLNNTGIYYMPIVFTLKWMEPHNLSHTCIWSQGLLREEISVISVVIKFCCKVSF
jgi:hypothetical protein